MIANVELLPLPELPRQVEGYSSDYWEASQVEEYATDYARACVAHATAAQDAEIDDLSLRLDVAIERSIESDHEESRLLDEIEALRERVSRLDEVNLELGRQLVEHEDRAERLAEALREARDYVTTALREEREKFAGHEDCSDIPGIEADLHKIDAALHPTAAQENDDA